MTELAFRECCEISTQTDFINFDYNYQIGTGLEQFIAPFCAPCPVEIAPVWHRYITDGYSSTSICSGAFVFLLVIGILTSILYGFVVVKRLSASKLSISFWISLSALLFALCQTINAILGVSGSWCDGTGMINAYRILRGLGLSFFFNAVLLQCFWYVSMMRRNLASVGNAFAGTAKYALGFLSIVILFVLVVLEPNAYLFLPAKYGATFAGVTIASAISLIVTLCVVSFLAIFLSVVVKKVVASLDSADQADWKRQAIASISTNTAVITALLLLYAVFAVAGFAYLYLEPQARFEISDGYLALKFYIPSVLPHCVLIAALFPFIKPSNKKAGGGATSSTDSLADSLLDDSDSSASSASSSSSADSGSSVELSEI